MKTSRQRLLEYIQGQRAVTAGDISRAMQMTSANARHHLAILEQQGLVAVVGQRPSKGKGRPAQLFSLSESAAGNHMAWLASALLEQFVSRLAEGDREQALQMLARRLAAGSSAATNLTQRLYQATRHLSELNYHARWEARADAPRVIFGHCPYAAILSEHPELCRMDVHLLEGLLDTPVRQTARLEQDRRGLTYCMFMVGKR